MKLLSRRIVSGTAGALVLGLVTALPASVPPTYADAVVPRPALVELVSDIRPGSASSILSNPGRKGLTTFGRHTYFGASTPAHGYELWRTDGVTAELFADMNPGSGSGGSPVGPTVPPMVFTDAGGWLYFSAYDGVTGNELWRTDGATWHLVQDINPGAFSSAPGDYAVLGDALFFQGTQTFPDHSLFAQPMTIQDTELWWTSPGLGAFRHEINPAERFIGEGVGTNPYSSLPTGLTTFKDHVYFSAGNGAPWNNVFDRELWRANRNGFERVADLASGVAGSSSPRNFMVAGDDLYFHAAGDAGTGLWRTGGAAPQFLHEFGDQGAEELTSFNGDLYFSGDRELWHASGATTRRILDINPTGDAKPRGFTALLDHLYFVANDGVHGQELWRTDGTAAGTVMVHDLFPGSGSGIVGSADPEFTELEGFLYFTGTDGVHGQELWRTNGTVTEMVRDLNPGSASSFPSGYELLGRHLLFTALDVEHGRELWRVGVPGPAPEGPPGHANCSDGLDNDEDGLVDLEDPDCQGDVVGAPAAPTGVRAARGDRAARVTWRSGKGFPATGFKVTATPGGRSVSVAANARKAIVKGLKNGTSYRFSVIATNAHGSSAAASSNRVTPAGKPGKVKRVKAKYVQKKSKKKRRLVLTWSAPRRNGAPVIRYRVRVKRKGAGQQVRTVVAPKRRLVLSRPKKGKYAITLRAHNKVGVGPISVKAKVRVR